MAAARALVFRTERCVALVTVPVDADADVLFHAVDIPLRRLPLAGLNVDSIVAEQSLGTSLVELGLGDLCCTLVLEGSPSRGLGDGSSAANMSVSQPLPVIDVVLV